MSKLCLGIESTAHTFGVAVVSFDGKVLSNEKDTYKTQSGGMIPVKVKKHHLEVKDALLKAALEKAQVLMGDIALISYSHGPGLGPSLLVGRDFAVELSIKYSIPVVGVNHAMAHLTIGDLMCGVDDPVYLYVSGVNTQVIARISNVYRIFGETLDIGLGNALDKFGRDLGLGFPAGPKIEQIAKGGKYVALPYSVKGMDVSFSGIVTKLDNLYKKGAKTEDLCYSFQETAFAMCAEVAERALAYTKKNSLLLVGGVAANKRFCEMLDVMCKERSATFFAVPLQYSGDQAAMIAWQGILQHVGSRKSAVDSKPNTLPSAFPFSPSAGVAEIYPYERIDEVKVCW